MKETTPSRGVTDSAAVTRMAAACPARTAGGAQVAEPRRATHSCLTTCPPLPLQHACHNCPRCRRVTPCAARQRGGLGGTGGRGGRPGAEDAQTHWSWWATALTATALRTFSFLFYIVAEHTARQFPSWQHCRSLPLHLTAIIFGQNVDRLAMTSEHRFVNLHCCAREQPALRMDCNILNLPTASTTCVGVVTLTSSSQQRDASRNAAGSRMNMLLATSLLACLHYVILYYLLPAALLSPRLYSTLTAA